MKKLFFMLLIALLALSATALAEAELTDVTVILDYVPNTNHTGMYVALERGYYAEAGLNVTIIEPTEGATNTLIAVGKGDIGVSYQEDVTIARTLDEPLPIRAIAHELSFADEYYFSNVFRRKTGLSPRAYRQNSQRSPET